MDYYSSIAAGYDELHGEEQDAKLRVFLDNIALPVNATVLDVGCATGRSLACFPDAQWHGIEPSDGLIARASPEARLRIRKGAAEALPWPDASFDCVLCLTVLQNVGDPEKALHELSRVCKPGGVILVSFIRKTEKADELDRLVRVALTVVDSWEFRQDAMYVCAG